MTMATLGGYYLGDHESQFDGSSLAGENCTPTSGANGADNATGGRLDKTGTQFRALIPRVAETNPFTPGWSLEDLDHACFKIGVGFEVRSGQGWAAVVKAWNAGLYTVIQGDSDQFSNATCSGAFNGDHAIGVHPATRVVNGLRQRWIDDPICKTGRWEFEYILRRYAAKFNSSIRFGVFTTPVPKVAAPPAAPVVTLRYGGKKLTPHQVKTVRVPAHQRANVRSRPTTAAPITSRKPNGQTFNAYQVTKTGQRIGGSSVWYGNLQGTRWMHISSF